MCDSGEMNEGARPFRLAIINSHPIQYFAPLYQRLSLERDIELTVYYCSRQGLEAYEDAGFGGQRVKWDVPLLDGYRAIFLRNWSTKKRLGGFWSLVNPAIVNEFHSKKYDVVWLHGYNYFTHMLAYMAARVFGLAIFVRGDTHLGLKRTSIRRYFRALFLKRYLSGCDACLAVGTRNEQFYLAHGVPRTRVFRVPYTVDNERFIKKTQQGRIRGLELRRRYGIEDDTPVVLYASKLSPRKRASDVIMAVSKLENTGRDCALVVVGSGSEELALKKLTQRLELDNVYFAGFVNQSEMPQYFAMADMFILPSESEPWGLVVNEAMCAGLPILVSSDVGAASDLVEPGVNGKVFDVGDIDAIAHHIGDLVEKPAIRKQMGVQSAKMIRKWDNEACIAGVRKALQALRSEKT